MQNELDRAGPVIDGLNAAIRDNPLAAGLIGAGRRLDADGRRQKASGMLHGGAARGAAGKAGSAAAAAGSAIGWRR